MGEKPECLFSVHSIQELIIAQITLLLDRMTFFTVSRAPAVQNEQVEEAACLSRLRWLCHPALKRMADKLVFAVEVKRAALLWSKYPRRFALERDIV